MSHEEELLLKYKKSTLANVLVQVEDYSVYGSVRCEINRRRSFCREQSSFDPLLYFTVTTLDGEKRATRSRVKRKYCHVFIVDG